MPTRQIGKPEEPENMSILEQLMESNPLVKSGVKRMQKNQDVQIDEATQAGVPATEILKTLLEQHAGTTLPTTPPIQEQSGLKQGLGKLLMGASEGWFGVSPSQTELNKAQAQRQQQSGLNDAEYRTSLIEQRKANTALMEKQLGGGETIEVYRDPVTGEEVDPEQAKKDMEEGLGVYQVNQKISTRSGVIEKPLNKVPNLTQEEKGYVNNSRMMGESLTGLETGFDNLYNKFGKANWQSFQMENVPYILAQDQDVQGLKSDLIYLKAAIPFLRGGKQLTKEEGKRIDVMLNPFGKTKETYKKDIKRFQNEFMYGADIMKFGINAPLMRRLIEGDIKKKSKAQQSTQSGWSQEKETRLQELRNKYGK